jgi:hypothetical protein
MAHAWRFPLVAAVLAGAGPNPVWPADLETGLPVSSQLSRMSLPRSLAGWPVRSVLERAGRRLRKPDCQRLFSAFNDEAGEPLQARLDAMNLSAERYLASVVFQDGAGFPPCANEAVLAFTTPGSRVVRVCATSFSRVLKHDPSRVEAIVIHETLHSLGLGENPPSSAEITKHVLQRCR